MDRRFQDIASHPSNRVFHVVFFPDRIYHAAYLNATRSSRYRYNVMEVRSKAEVTVLKGEVYLDGAFYTNFLRIEYRSARLVESVRIKNRMLGATVRCRFRVWMDTEERGLNQNQILDHTAEIVKLHYCPWVDAYQVELWQTLEPPPGNVHDFDVVPMIGKDGSITRRRTLSGKLAEVKRIREVDLEFFENDEMEYSGYFLPTPGPFDPARDLNQPQDDPGLPARDNFYMRNLQVPNDPFPSDRNTVQKANYTLTFIRNFYIPSSAMVAPVRYRNAMMDERHPLRRDDNIIAMRWLLQEELGGSLVFFHEVEIEPGKIEGTHQHIGSEELYYIVEGEGFAYLGANDSPAIAHYETVKQPVFGLDPKDVKKVPVGPGAVIFTKSGGIHGIENTSADKPLKFVAFLYHSA